jgi:hypothetical protein
MTTADRDAVDLKGDLVWLVHSGFSVAVRTVPPGRAFHVRAVREERPLEADDEKIEAAVAKVRRAAERRMSEGLA